MALHVDNDDVSCASEEFVTAFLRKLFRCHDVLAGKKYSGCNDYISYREEGSLMLSSHAAGLLLHSPHPLANPTAGPLSVLERYFQAPVDGQGSGNSLLAKSVSKNTSLIFLLCLSLSCLTSLLIQGQGVVVTRSPETWCLCLDRDTHKLYLRDSHRKTQCVISQPVPFIYDSDIAYFYDVHCACALQVRFR